MITPGFTLALLILIRGLIDKHHLQLRRAMDAVPEYHATFEYMHSEGPTIEQSGHSQNSRSNFHTVSWSISRENIMEEANLMESEQNVDLRTKILATSFRNV